jgi:hypothetical protein
MSRCRAVGEWTHRAIEKFYLGFIIPDRVSYHFHDYGVFFYAHGLEVLCKAYIVGKEFPRYKDKSFTKAKKEIDNIVKRFSHNLESLVDELIRYGVIPTDFLSKVHCRLNVNEIDITNREILKTLRSLYLEARYPVPQLDYQRFYEERIKGNRNAKNRRSVGILSASHEPGTFARKLFALVLKRIEKDFGLEISREKPHHDIDDRDWERFSNLFFRQSKS